MDDKRLVFDSISGHFEKWREKYTGELFGYIIETCGLDETKKCLEIGPGTGQATDFALDTGCDYTAIELGENLAEIMKKKYGGRSNFRIIVDDFEKHEFEPESFDLVYSAATIQWIDEKIAYEKCFDMLRSGGYLAMFRMLDDYRTPNPELHDDIQRVYSEHYAVEIPYTCRFGYENGEEYGFTYLGRKEFFGQRSYTADEFAEFIKTNADLITIKESNREPFFRGIREAILRHENRIFINSTYVLDLYRK